MWVTENWIFEWSILFSCFSQLNPSMPSTSEKPSAPERDISYTRHKNTQIHPNTLALSVVPLLHVVVFSFLQRWREARDMHYWFQLQSAQSSDRRHTYENTQTDSGCVFFISLCASVLTLSFSLSLFRTHTHTLPPKHIQRRRTCMNILCWCLQILAVIKTTQQNEFTLSLFESQQSPRVCSRARDERSRARAPSLCFSTWEGGGGGATAAAPIRKQTPAVWQPGCLLHPPNINILLSHLWAGDKTPTPLGASKQHKGQHLRLAFPRRDTRISTNRSIKRGSVGIRSARSSDHTQTGRGDQMLPCYVRVRLMGFCCFFHHWRLGKWKSNICTNLAVSTMAR